MNVYRVHMAHWQRYEPAPEGATFIEHIEVVVSAPTGAAAAKAAEALLGNEWNVRVVMVEQKAT